jgi:hypothetical protein
MRNLKGKQIKEEAEKVLKVLSKFVHLKGFFRKFMLIFTLFLFFNVITVPGGKNLTSASAAFNPPLTEEAIYVKSVKNRINNQLVGEVGRYIKRMAPNSGLSPEHLVTKCLEYDTDIIFVLAQGLLESHFGTRGKAAETNSVWNVGTYDNGRILYRYDTPDQSLEPYLTLVNEKYLIEVTSQGDTIFKDLYHLVQDKGYTNYDGRRFASARGYENGMRKLMVQIDMQTSIGFYQDILTLEPQEMLSFFSPPNEIDPIIFYALN